MTGPAQTSPTPPPAQPSWYTEPARVVGPRSSGGWRRGVSLIGLVLVLLTLLVAAALLIGALRQLVGTELQPTSAPLPAEITSLTVVADHGDILLSEGEERVVRTVGPSASFNQGRIDVVDRGAGIVEVTITQPDRLFPFPIGPNRASSYELVVPAGSLESAVVRTDLGDVTTDYGVGALQVQTEVGDIEIQHVTGGERLSARSALGDVRVTASSADRVDVTTDVGEVDIDLTGAADVPTEVSAVSDVGNIDIVLPAAPEGTWYRTEVAAEMGGIHDSTRTVTPVPGGTETSVLAETSTGSVRITEQ